MFRIERKKTRVGRGTENTQLTYLGQTFLWECLQGGGLQYNTSIGCYYVTIQIQNKFTLYYRGGN